MTAAVQLTGITTQFGQSPIHDQLDLTINRGEMLSLIGGSGTGKSVMLRIMAGLMKPHQGRVQLMGVDLHAKQPEPGSNAAMPEIGVLFQGGALFTSLTVSENIQLAIAARHKLSNSLLKELAAMKISLVGLPCEAGAKLPAELSGGMVKRAALARALALDPAIIFLDEPTAGLDPIGANSFDELIETLRAHLNLTVVMITHDIDSLKRLSDRVAVLLDKKAKTGTFDEIASLDHPWVQRYFGGVRGRAAGLSEPQHSSSNRKAKDHG